MSSSPPVPRAARATGFRAGIVALALPLAVAGCSSTTTSGGQTPAATSQDTATPAGSSAPDEAAPSDTLTVFAAASLRDVLEPIGEGFTAGQRADDGDVEVTYSFAGSSDLVSQLASGAPADVLVTADESSMDTAVEQRLVAGDPTVVATNTLTLVTPAGNPASVTGLDASLEGADLVVCAPQVPCGRATEELAAGQGVTLAPVSEENSVTDVLGKVTSGQADAGIVYRTDARSAEDQVEAIEPAGADEVVNRYPAAVTRAGLGGGNVELAADFVEYLTSDEAQSLFADAGFGRP